MNGQVVSQQGEYCMTNGPGTESRLTNISQYHVENYRFDLQDSNISLPLTAAPRTVSAMKYTGLDIHAGMHMAPQHKKRPHSPLRGLLTGQN